MFLSLLCTMYDFFVFPTPYTFWFTILFSSRYFLFFSVSVQVCTLLCLLVGPCTIYYFCFFCLLSNDYFRPYVCLIYSTDLVTTTGYLCGKTGWMGVVLLGSSINDDTAVVTLFSFMVRLKFGLTLACSYIVVLCVVAVFRCLKITTRNLHDETFRRAQSKTNLPPHLTSLHENTK